MKEYSEVIVRNSNDYKVYFNCFVLYIKFVVFNEVLKDVEKCIEFEFIFVKGYMCKGYV